MLDEPNRLGEPDSQIDGNGDGPGAPRPVDAATAEELELAAALAAVLARKPRRFEPSPPAGSDEEADLATALVTPDARRAFVSALRHQASPALHSAGSNAGRSDFDDVGDMDDLGDLAGDASSKLGKPGAVRWLAAVRHRNLRSSLHNAGAWLATIAIGTTIVAFAAVVLFEGPRGLAAWLDLAIRTL